MLFGQKNILHSSVEILDTILRSDDIKGNDGAVVVERKEGRKTVQTGTLFFHSDLVYAVKISDMPVPIANRVATGGKVDIDEIKSIVRYCGNDPYSPDVVRQLLVNHLISEKELDSYVKEHFLDNIAEILSWENCSGKWYPGERTKDFTMPSLSFPRLKQIIAGREIKRHDFAKEVSRFFRPEEFDSIMPLKTPSKEQTFTPEVSAIIEHSNGENTFKDISVETGIGTAVVLQTINTLWKMGTVSLKYGAIEVSYESALLANQPKEEKVEEVPEDSVPIVNLNDPEPTPEPEPVVETELVDESLLPSEENPTEDDPEPDDTEPTEEPNTSVDNENVDTPQEMAPEKIAEAEEDLEAIMTDIYTKFDIHHVEFDSEDDVIDIEPLNVSASREVEPSATVEDADAEIEVADEGIVEESEASDLSDSAEDHPVDDSGADEADEAIAPVEEEKEEPTTETVEQEEDTVQNEEVTAEPTETIEKGTQDESVEASPIRSLPELMVKLAELQSLGGRIDEEIAETSEQLQELADVADERGLSSAMLREESKAIEKECDEIRARYEELTEKLEKKYNELSEAETAANESHLALEAGREKLRLLDEKKESNLSVIENVTRSFSIR